MHSNPSPVANLPVSDVDEDVLAQEIAQRILAEQQVLGGASPTYEELVGRQWKIHPVDPATFLFDHKYAGRYGDNLYKKWREELVYVLDPANGITEWIITGAIGLGKSTVAALALAYKLYRIGCLLNPNEYFKLMADSNITFGVYSLYKYASQDNNYTTLKKMIDGIPFFRQFYPRPKHLSNSAKDDLSFPHRVNVVAGSTELHAIGLNLLCLLMDEVNFMHEKEKGNGTLDKLSQAQELYTASKRRLESRYQYRGVTPGLMVLISSRNAESSWLERHLAETAGNPGVHVSDYSLWDVKWEVMGYAGKRFFVEVGDFIHPSRIIEKPTHAREGAQVVAPPVEHLAEFQKDLDGSLRDLAGVASIAVSPLIRDKEPMRATLDPKLEHPFTLPAFPISHLDDVPINRYFRMQQVIQVVKSFPRPRLNPHAPRYAHVDLSESGDATGIAMGHISKIEGTNPHISMDFMLRIMAPRNGQIDFSKIVEFFCWLQTSCGYPLKRVSFDRFQSTHARQILTKMGFESPHFTVDKTDEPYIVLRSTIQEGRLSLYDYAPFFTEMDRLIHDRVKRKVDHPDGGSKDVSDAVCGVVAQLTTAMGEDERIRGQSSTGQLAAPQAVKTLAERLEETGALANNVAGRSSRRVV